MFVKEIKNGKIQSNRHQKRFESKINTTISTLKSELTLNCCLNSDGLQSESSAIQFAGPNRLSLPGNVNKLGHFTHSRRLDADF